MALCSIDECGNRSVCQKMCHKHYSRWRRHGDVSVAKTDHRPAELRFWKYVKKTDGCWLWTGFLNMNGYGKIAVGGRKMVSAHRFSYQLHKGEDPAGWVVMHSCDNPACVNPDHLSLGTQKENTADMFAKNRGNRRTPHGEGNPNSRLTEAAVRLIRTSPATGKDLAAQLGVSETAVSEVRTRKRWKHIT